MLDINAYNDFQNRTGGKQTVGGTADLSNIDLSGAAGNWFTGNVDYQRQVEREERAFQYNAYEAQKQRDFEERLSNTALERQASQLERLGINPSAYFLGGGQGASTPAGATASGASGSVSRASQGFGAVLGALAKLIGLGVSAYSGAKSAQAVTVKEHYNAYGDFQGYTKTFRR